MFCKCFQNKASAINPNERNERENIQKRQSEGIAAAKARGVRYGRPIKSPPKISANSSGRGHRAYQREYQREWDRRRKQAAQGTHE
jgi:DNA invertase Pin-like site-specific DNA recombinase